MTQNEAVLAYIRRNGAIDPITALNELGILRLAARVADLRSLGHNIVTETKTRKLPDGTKKSWAEYKMPSPVCKTEGRQEDGKVGTNPVLQISTKV